MFNVKIQLREEVKPKIGMYFLYNHEIFKLIEPSEEQKGLSDFGLIYYDEKRGNVVSLSEGYSSEFLMQGILAGTYVVIDENILGEILIPEVMKKY